MTTEAGERVTYEGRLVLLAHAYTEENIARMRYRHADPASAPRELEVLLARERARMMAYDELREVLRALDSVADRNGVR
jgi:hypothetical protein